MIVIVAGVPGLGVCKFAGAADTLAAIAVASTLTVTALMLLACGTAQAIRCRSSARR